MKLLIMRLFFQVYFLFSSQAPYLSQHPVLEGPQSITSIQRTVHCVLFTAYCSLRTSYDAVKGTHKFTHKNINFFVTLRPNAGHGLFILDVSRSHTTTHYSRQDSSGRVISSSQRPLPDSTQHSQQTNVHAPGGIRTHDLIRRDKNINNIFYLNLSVFRPLHDRHQGDSTENKPDTAQILPYCSTTQGMQKWICDSERLGSCLLNMVMSSPKLYEVLPKQIFLSILLNILMVHSESAHILFNP